MTDSELISKLNEAATKSTPNNFDKILKAAQAQGLINSGSSGASVKVNKVNTASGATKAVAKVAVKTANKKLAITIVASFASIFAALVIVLGAIFGGWFGGNSVGGNGGNGPSISVPEGDGGNGEGSNPGGDGDGGNGGSGESGPALGGEISDLPTVASEGLKYTLSDDGTYYNCAGFSGDPFAEIVIASEYEGLPVKGIANKAFALLYDDEREIITSVTIPDSVTYIGEISFAGNNSLSSITIPDSVTEIDEGAFAQCPSLESVTLPDSVTKLGRSVFGSCTALKSMNIPKNVTEIGYDVFWKCKALESLTVDSGNTVYHSANNCIIETATKTLIAGCNTSVIPDDGSVTAIGPDAFYGSNIKSVTIPDGVTSIGASAFGSCSSLTSINIPDGVTTIADSTFYSCEFLESIIIPASVETIGFRAFAFCSRLKSVTLNDGLKTIDDEAFHVSGLTEITIPASVTSIGQWVFAECSALRKATIYSSAFGRNTFAYCYGLDEMYISNNFNGNYGYGYSILNDLSFLKSSLREVIFDGSFGDLRLGDYYYAWTPVESDKNGYENCLTVRSSYGAKVWLERPSIIIEEFPL